MKTLPIILGAGLAVTLLSKPKTKVKKVNNENPPLDAPKINEENIYKYYSKDPVCIKDIPFIYTSLNDMLKDYYDPQSENGIEKAYIYLQPDFASAIWSTLPILFEQGYMGDDKLEADKTTKKVLIDLAGDVYWKEGLVPYIAYSPFYYVWVSVNYLIRISWVNYTKINDVNYVPGSIEV